MHMNFLSGKPLAGKTALVTGASRGIGASVSRQLAEHGANVIINFRSKRPRAERVGEAVKAAGTKSILVQADICNEGEVRQMMQTIKQEIPQLDLLILNASGGLEKDKPASYAMLLNCTAQENLLHASLPLLTAGSRVIFVTSHLAHFYGEKTVYTAYEPVAKSKKAGELALLNRIPELTEKGISLVIVSGDLIEGTITPKLMERSSRGLIETRREQAGSLPTVDDFALAIVHAAFDKTLTSGDVIFVGNTD